MLKVKEMLSKTNSELLEYVSGVNIDLIDEVYSDANVFCDSYRECIRDLKDGDDLLIVEYFLEIDSNSIKDEY